MVELIGVEFGPVHMVAVGGSLFIALLAIIKWRSNMRRMDNLLKVVNESDSEKAHMYNRLKELEEENKKVTAALRNVENEFRERVQSFEEVEKKTKIEGKRLDDDLLKIKGIKESLELHRARVGTLEMEKADLQRKLKDAMAAYEEEFAVERRKLEGQMREIKEHTKETVDQIAKEKDVELKKLKDENQELKAMVGKLKERLGLWEAVGDL